MLLTESNANIAAELPYDIRWKTELFLVLQNHRCFHLTPSQLTSLTCASNM